MDRRLNLRFIEGVILMFTNLSLKYESENPWDLITYYLYSVRYEFFNVDFAENFGIGMAIVTWTL